MNRFFLLVATLPLLAGCGDIAQSHADKDQTAPATVAESEKTAAVDGTAGTRARAGPSPAPVRPRVETAPAANLAEAAPEPPAMPAAPQPPAKPAPQGGELVLKHIRLAPPGNWPAKQPDEAYLLAEYALPRAAGDDADGRVTVTTAGGGVKQVLALWRESFGGKPEKESQEELNILGLWASLVDMSGTYRTRASLSAPFESHPNYRMLAVMCDVGDPNRMYFIKALGPAKTIAAHEKEFRALANSIRLRQ